MGVLAWRACLSVRTGKEGLGEAGQSKPLMLFGWTGEQLEDDTHILIHNLGDWFVADVCEDTAT